MSDLDDFKNFHRNLCERFGYHHDPVDWKRDQASLEEHIAKQFGLEYLTDHLFKMRDRHSRLAWDEIQGTEEWALQTALCAKVQEILDFIRDNRRSAP